MPNQKLIQPSQLEELKLNVGFLRGYTVSTNPAPNTIPIRDEHNNTIFDKLQVNENLLGNVVGNVTGNLTGNVEGNLTGNVTGNLTGNVEGNLEGTSVKASTLEVSTVARILKTISSVEGTFIGISQGNHYGEFDGNYKGQLTGSVHGEVIGNLRGNSYGTHIGSVVGNIEGNFTGNLIGNVTGDVIGNVTGSLTGNVDGNSATASKLRTPINVSLIGDIDCTKVFNGSEDLILETNLKPLNYLKSNTVEIVNTLKTESDSVKIVGIDNNNTAVDFIQINNNVENPTLNLTNNVTKDSNYIYTENGRTIRVLDGGTGTTSITGIIKGNNTSPFTSAIAGVDYVSPESTETLKNKTIDTNENNIRNLKVSNFNPDIITTDFSIINVGSNTKIPTELAVKNLVESTYTGLSWKNSVRVATTESKNILTDFAKDCIIDGITLRVNDRILIKNQNNNKENGIYAVNISGKPTRSIDADLPQEITNSAVYVVEGTANKNTGWVCSSKVVQLETDAIVYNQFSGTNLYLSGDGISIAGNTINVTEDIVTLNKNQILTNKTITGTFTGNLTGTATNCSGNANTANHANSATNLTGGTVSATTGTFANTINWKDGNSDNANIAYAERHQWDGNSINLNPVTGRNSLELGDIATQNKNNIQITGGSITGINKLLVSDGGTGVTNITGLVKGTGTTPFTPAIAGVDYVAPESTETLKNKTIDANENTIRNLKVVNFNNNTIDNSPLLLADSDEKIPTQKAVKSYVDRIYTGTIWRQPVHCATVADVNINSIKPGLDIDGVVLSEGLRVLVKDQILASENGVYAVPAAENTAQRAQDFNLSNNFRNSAVVVLQGNQNGGTSWLCSNIDPIIEWSSPIIWNLYGVKNTIIGTGLKYNLNTILADDNVLLFKNIQQNIINKKIDSTSVKFSNFSNDEGTLKFGLNNKGTITIASNSTEDKTYSLPDKSGTLYVTGGQIIPVIDGGTGISTLNPNSILVSDNSNNFTQLQLTDNSKSLLQAPNIKNYLNNLLELSDIATYSLNDLTINFNTKYAKLDGSNSFTNPMPGIYPVNNNHLVTKDYVDTLLKGVRYLATVVSDSYLSGTGIPNINIGDSFLVPANAISNWINKDNQIATLNNIINGTQSWTFVTATAGDIINVISKNCLMQWNGTSWINIGQPSVNDHDALINVKGGKWHLSEAQYISLFNSTDPVTDHNHKHNTAIDIQGGTPNNRWHLSDNQYNELTGITTYCNVHKHDHNTNANLQGGILNEKYHLSLLEHTELTSHVSTSLHTHFHYNLANILGDGDYHLSSAQIEGLVRGNSTNIHKHDHNNANNIQGGASNEKYHLSHSQYLNLTNNNDTNIHTHNHENLIGVLGGNGLEQYHLDRNTYLKVIEYDFNLKNHNDTANIQGGNTNERYHLSLEKYNQIMDFNGNIGNHNTLNNIQGGNDTERYHISLNEKTYLTNIQTNGILHSEIKGKLGSGEYHLSQIQYEELTSSGITDLHKHNIYINIDGSNKFLAPIEGVMPTIDNHLTTKSYVDLLAVGIKWDLPVISKSITDPTTITTITAGDRYIIPDNAINGWELNVGKIAIYTTEWTYITPDNNTAVFVKDIAGSYIYYNNKWIQISASPIIHDDLNNLKGGNWHLNSNEYIALTQSGNTDLHYHLSDRDLNNSTGTLSVIHGGTGLNSIPANNILVSSTANTMEIAPISPLGKNIIKVENTAELKQIMQYGTIANQDSHNVNISGGTIKNITPLEVKDGGTGTNGLTGIIKGNGINAFSNAVANVDYVTPSGNCILRNKSINARSDGNQIKNLNLTDFNVGIISTDVLLSDLSDEKLVTQKAIKTYIDSKTTGENNGMHEFGGNIHKFSGAVPNSLLVYYQDTDSNIKYKNLLGSTNINIEHQTENIKISLSNDVVITNSTQILSNKTIISPKISSNEWLEANHTHENADTGGQLTENALASPISPLKGGTGLSSIEKDHIIYATQNNIFEQLKLGTLFKNNLACETFTDFIVNNNNTLPKIKQISFEVPALDTSYIPNINSTSNLNINTEETLNINSKNINITTPVATGKIEFKAKEINETINSKKIKIAKFELDFTDYLHEQNKGLYLKDNISNLPVNCNSTLFIGGTLGIAPTNILFSDSNKIIEHTTSNNKMSSVILLNNDASISDNYSVTGLEFILDDPANVPNQYVYIKLITANNITIKSKNNKRIDGELFIKLTQKYQAVTLYATNNEWFIL